jgi:hypothetical protein
LEHSAKAYEAAQEAFRQSESLLKKK